MGVSAEQQLLSPSNLLQHFNYASSKLRPAFNHFYSQFVPILHLCCREISALFLEPLHISLSFAFFSLVLSSVEVFHVLLVFFPLNDFFFFSLLQLSAVEEEAVPFVWLYVPCQLNLNACLTSASSVSCHTLLSLLQTCVFLLLPSSLLDKPCFWLIPCSVCREQSSAFHSSQHHVPHFLWCFRGPNPLWCTRGVGGSSKWVLHTGLLSAFHHCYLSYCWHMGGNISLLC